MTQATDDHRAREDAHPEDDRLIDSPTDLDKRSWRYVIRRTVREFSSDQCTDLAAALTYYAVLALFPAAIALTSVLGLVDQGRNAVTEVLTIVRSLGGGSMVESIEPTLVEISTSQAAGLALVLGLVGALWSASGYVGAFGRAMNRVYEIDEGRPVWKLRPTNAAGVLADPVFSSVAVERLLSRDRAHDILSSPLVATHGGVSQTDQEQHTTHVTAADTDGNTVAITQSIGSVTGAGVMTPSLGFFYNNFLGFFNPSPGYHDSMVPGKRVGGGCPTIAFRRGRPVLGIGSSGGSRLVSAVFQSILNMFVHGLTPQEAVSAPRFHCEQDGRLYLEPTFSPETIGALRDKGYEVIPTSYMGCNQAVLFDDGLLGGGSDPRGGIGIAIV